MEKESDDRSELQLSILKRSMRGGQTLRSAFQDLKSAVVNEKFAGKVSNVKSNGDAFARKGTKYERFNGRRTLRSR